jgi:hypothetical protein
MASDSRLTMTNTDSSVAERIVVSMGVSQSDTNYKTFLGKGNIGISTFGAATIQGVPISGYIETFLNEKLTDGSEIDGIPQLLIDYFHATPEVPDAGFHVAGYKKIGTQMQQRIWRCFVKPKAVVEIVPKQQLSGALWDGETDVMTRLVHHTIHSQNEKGEFLKLSHFGIPFNMFTLQDMIDFAVYAIRTTADTMRFQMRGKTVGGPVDVLVIKPTESIWISRKTLAKRDSE